MNNELEKELINIALVFMYNALNGIKGETNPDYYITVYKHLGMVEIVLHNIKTEKIYNVYFKDIGLIDVIEG